MYWQRDARVVAGGRWECRVKRSEYNKRRHEQRLAWNRNYYDTDPVYRTRSILNNGINRRRRQREKRREDVPENPLLAEYLIALRPKGA